MKEKPKVTRTVYTIKEGYTSIDYGRNESKRRRKEALSGFTHAQILQMKIEARNADRKAVDHKKFEKPKA